MSFTCHGYFQPIFSVEVTQLKRTVNSNIFTCTLPKQNHSAVKLHVLPSVLNSSLSSLSGFLRRNYWTIYHYFCIISLVEIKCLVRAIKHECLIFKVTRHLLRNESWKSVGESSLFSPEPCKPSVSHMRKYVGIHAQTCRIFGLTWPAGL